MCMNTNDEIAKRLKSLRENKGLTQGALASLCGWKSQSRIGNYESGARKLSTSDAETIAKVLGVSASQILFGDQEPSNFSYVGPNIKGEKYPLISWVSAGAWCEAIEPYALKDIDEWFQSDARIEGNGFWLRVEGDSMTAPTGLSIPEDTLVLFDTGREARNGSLVIAKLETANEATFKKLIIDGGAKYLRGLNPAWPLVPINGNCKIIGVAVETKMRLV
ncbi:repressor [Yersinia entomophaga]|uniref:Repressor n=1 Tax=Yersinia entomophaga TaxID=935293 RepID=A0ABM6BRH3_YERET|nr:XRE family transcriptional regulator [Yersinia entomophaga]ANI31939.1 repressor [Yersinia entomophaga]OWF84490.1 LexA family transcriptional repressor [Yersinia entomophaga]